VRVNEQLKLLQIDKGKHKKLEIKNEKKVLFVVLKIVRCQNWNPAHRVKGLYWHDLIWIFIFSVNVSDRIKCAIECAYSYE